MDKPSPVYAWRSAAGISHDASERSASISQASRINSLSRLCGLCFGELHHRSKAEDPGGASGAPPSSTCPDRNASPRRRPFLHHRKDTMMQGDGSFCPSHVFIFMKRQLPDEAESRFKRRRRERSLKKHFSVHPIHHVEHHSSIYSKSLFMMSFLTSVCCSDIFNFSFILISNAMVTLSF